MVTAVCGADFVRCLLSVGMSSSSHESFEKLVECVLKPSCVVLYVPADSSDHIAVSYTHLTFYLILEKSAKDYYGAKIR